MTGGSYSSVSGYYDYVTIKYNSSGVEQWVAKYNGPGNGSDVAYAIAIDGSGNVYVTGFSRGSGTGDDYATIKYNPSGIEQWVAKYNGPGNNNDEAYAIVVDSLGNVYVTGFSYGSGTYYDYATIKYNPSGIEQWVARYNGPGDYTYDYARAIFIDGSGNVYVTGGSYSSVAGYYDYATIKYNSLGAEEWVARYDGSGNRNDQGDALVVDSLGNVYVTGFSDGSRTGYDYATIKYNPSGIEQWVARYNGPGDYTYDYARAIFIDGSGNVYVTGGSKGSGSDFDYDYATIKYNSSGAEEWVARYDGSGNDNDQGYAIVVDSLGNVYVAGFSYGSGTYYDYATIKYNSSGIERWVVRYDGQGKPNGIVNAIVIDGSGNVYVTGVSEGSGTGDDYATIKYNSSGVEQWVAKYNGPGNYDDGAYAIAIDGLGNVYVTGFSYGSGTSYDYATIKYNSSGAEEWVARYDGSRNDNDQGYAIVVDSLGNVYVTGRSKGSEYYYDYATIKYNSSGAEEWVARYDGSRNDNDQGYAIVVDSLGNVYVTGRSKGSEYYYDYATIKYNSSGAEKWVARYNGPGNKNDEAYALVVDSLGNVYVTGFSYGSGTYHDYATIKYDSSGVEQWVARYNGPGNSDDEAYALVVDGSGDVYVTGGSFDSTSSYYATIKYNPSGIEQWVARYNGPGDYTYDYARAISIDGSGNVYVTGRSGASGTYSDYATIKYDSSGVEQWVARYNGPGNHNDKAYALVVDGSGNIYVTGYSKCLGTRYDYATIKYSIDGKEQWIVRYNGPGNLDDYGTAIAIDTAGNVYVAGTSGGYYATIKYEQSIIPNASIMDSLWSNPSIWSLGHVPLSSDDVMIQHNVVIDTLQQDSIQSLILPANGILSIKPGVGLLKIASIVQIEDSGKIEFQPGAEGMIIYESFINRGMFECGTSSITFLGNTFLSTNKITFYNFISDEAACFAGDLAINNKLRLNNDLNIRLQDSVHIVNSDTNAIEGSGRIPRGTVKRAIAPISQSKYRFESLNSYLQFGEPGSNPHNVSITTYPDINPSSFGNKWVVVPSHVDPVANVITADSVTGFSKWVFGIPRPTGMESEYEISSFIDTISLVRRVYDIHVEGGEGFQARLSLRYEQSEVPIGIQEDSLKLFRLEGTVDVTEKLKELPKKFSLEQNYPNPFNPSTVISYSLPVNSWVTLKVYNLLGQGVMTLVDEKREAGRYEIQFRADKLPSGVYIYRMQAGEFISSKKLLVLK